MSLDNAVYHTMEVRPSKLEGKADPAGASDSGDSRSTLISKNVTILGRRTSVRLEPEMWNALKDISRREHCSIHDICSLINIRKNPLTSLTAAIRVFLMLYYRASSTEEGHARVGHGSFENMKRRARINVDLKLLRTPSPLNPIGMSDTPQSDYQWVY